METIPSIGVIDALEKLSFPSFFNRGERKAAYDLVMTWGNQEERFAAEKAKNRFPFEAPEETLFPFFYSEDFPIASKVQQA